VINASAVKFGYISGFSQTTISIKVMDIKQLIVKVSVSPTKVISEGRATLTVEVTDNQNKVSDVSLKFNTTMGSFSVYEEIADGVYRCTYIAPVVMTTTQCIINVTASKLNYRTGYGECKIFIYPKMNREPICVIKEPKDNDTVKGIYIITGAAHDPDGEVIRVEVNVSGKWVNATGTSSWSYQWNTTKVLDGKYTIYARAFDGHNYSKIVRVNVFVKNEKDKIDLSEHSSLIVIIAGAFIGLLVGFLIIVLRRHIKTKIPEKVEEEIEEEEEEIEEIVPLPTCRISAPASHETVTGVYKIKGTAEPVGDNPIKKVEVKIDKGSWQRAKGTTSWVYTWDTTEVRDGSHKIYVRAYDGEKYSNIIMRDVSVENWV
jgi:hypothetical protein